MKPNSIRSSPGVLSQKDSRKRSMSIARVRCPWCAISVYPSSAKLIHEQDESSPPINALTPSHRLPSAMTSDISHLAPIALPSPSLAHASIQHPDWVSEDGYIVLNNEDISGDPAVSGIRLTIWFHHLPIIYHSQRHPRPVQS